MRRNLAFILFVFIFSGCEKVIDLDLEFTEKRIVVDAKINKHVNSKNGFARVTISKTTNYFDDEITFIENAEVIIKEIESGVEYELNFSKENQYYIEIENISKSSDYELNIYHENNHYQSKNILRRSPPIGNVKQGQRKSLNNDEIEIVTSFKDIENDDNYYLFEFGKGNLQPADDIYIEGNNFTFSYFINKNKIQNNELEIKMEGIDFQYFKFIIQVIIQTNTQNGPFAAPPTSIKGNIYCVNNDSLNPFGYFNVSEFDTFTLKDINVN